MIKLTILCPLSYWNQTLCKRYYVYVRTCVCVCVCVRTIPIHLGDRVPGMHIALFYNWDDQNLKGLSLRTSFSHSTGHNNECFAAHNSFLSDPTMTVDRVTQILNTEQDTRTQVGDDDG